MTLFFLIQQPGYDIRIDIEIMKLAYARMKILPLPCMTDNPIPGKNVPGICTTDSCIMDSFTEKCITYTEMDGANIIRLYPLLFSVNQPISFFITAGPLELFYKYMAYTDDKNIALVPIIILENEKDRLKRFIDDYTEYLFINAILSDFINQNEIWAKLHGINNHAFSFILDGCENEKTKNTVYESILNYLFNYKSGNIAVDDINELYKFKDNVATLYEEEEKK